MNRYYRLLSVIIVCAYFWYYANTYTEWHFIDNVNLIFHEAGHTIFSFFGTFINVLAGSVFQVILPLFISIYFFYKMQKISGALCLLWVGQNLLNVSVYAGDAVKMQLELLGGDSVNHDWNYILNALGIISHTDTIASIIYILGIITIFFGSILSMYFSMPRQSSAMTNRNII